MPSPRGSSRSRDQTRVSGDSCTAGGFFTAEHRGSPGLGEELGYFGGKPGKGFSSPDRDWKEGKAEVGK